MNSGNIKGMDKLLKKLDSLNINSKQELKKSMEKNIKMVQGEAKLLCPVDNGDLRNSITTDVKEVNSGIVATVTTNYEIAPYVEFGTGKKGETTSVTDKYPGQLSYKQDKWKVNIPDVGVRWIEGQPAQPYLYPALKNNEELVKKNIASDLEKKIREVAGR
ncbi:MAG: HK97 gp10 family phage protein [Clostridium sp.]|uniref:HK97-gp10 family putative phage morphogenesis protein n=1 Tax=Clostridium sp. TaxID=1506 RepID=UPI003217C8FB